MTVLAVPVALAVGLVIGALGGGGAILTVPALVHLLGQSPHQATTSSLVIVGTTSLIAMVPHARQGNIRVGQGLAFGLLGVAGALAGSAVSARIRGEVLLLTFAGLMLVVAALMVRRALSPATGDPDEPTEPMLTLRPLTCACPRVVKVVVTATAVGLLTGLLGVGGGFILVPALVLALSLPMPAAVGTSLLVIAVNSATAFAARLTLTPEPIDWQLIAAFTTVAAFGSLAGARLSTKLPARAQTVAFAALLTLVATYTAAATLL
ncbi:sulfite exporter TauE/SafE family protein [Oryzobacter terrae]|uniref:sulfite exporter TauE/SafE family protein n=1 Tax=Oryzobacter terrae TaxID=1620385 RepID=UPI0036725193